MMNPYYYDLHIHSCLSPCADNDMTPENIAGMAQLKGLQILALTDHNSCGNCPPFFKACKQAGIIPIAGMELTTAEEIHIVCLFPSLDAAMEFDGNVRKHRMPIANRPEIFGDQILMGDDDEPCGTESDLLISATDLSVSDSVRLVRRHGGIAYPAHVDRESNGIIAILGDVPRDVGFTCVEFHDSEHIQPYGVRYPSLNGLLRVCSSDAHHLWDINEAEHTMTVRDEPYSSTLVTVNLLELLHNGGSV